MPMAVSASQLADFQCRLIGTWTNNEELSDPDRNVPLSFNVMPLPQIQDQPNRPSGGDFGGFILKNFAFTETIRFNGSAKPEDPPEHQDPDALAVVASAPNRGGSYTQSSHAIFYDQQVQFAEGPQGPASSIEIGQIVHVENGAWLHFGSENQVLGPYLLGSGPLLDGPVLPQPPYVTVAKQISVPHGNSVLALGHVDIRGRDENGNPLTVLPGPTGHRRPRSSPIPSLRTSPSIPSSTRTRPCWTNPTTSRTRAWTRPGTPTGRFRKR